MKTGNSIKLILLLAVIFLGMISFKGIVLKNSRFMVIAPHTAEECLQALDEVNSKPGLLAKFDWGCKHGDHTGYAMLEGENEEAVRNMLPALGQKNAKIIQVDKFTAQEIEAAHKK
jgi:hypothetical protein